VDLKAAEGMTTPAHEQPDDHVRRALFDTIVEWLGVMRSTGAATLLSEVRPAAVSILCRGRVLTLQQGPGGGIAVGQIQSEPDLRQPYQFTVTRVDG